MKKKIISSTVTPGPQSKTQAGISPQLPGQTTSTAEEVPDCMFLILDPNCSRKLTWYSNVNYVCAIVKSSPGMIPSPVIVKSATGGTSPLPAQAPSPTSAPLQPTPPATGKNVSPVPPIPGGKLNILCEMIMMPSYKPIWLIYLFFFASALVVAQQNTQVQKMELCYKGSSLYLPDGTPLCVGNDVQPMMEYFQTTAGVSRKSETGITCTCMSPFHIYE